MYTDRFVKRVEQAYGENSKEAELARSGSCMLGHHLNDGCCGYISLDSFFNLPLGKLIDIAKLEKEKSDLYSDWRSGRAYADNDIQLNYCPANYMNLVNYPFSDEYTHYICDGVGYVGYYPGCVRYSHKENCWRKYHELKSNKNEGERTHED